MGNIRGMNSSCVRSIIRHQDELYEILRTIPVHNFENKDHTINLEALKAWQEYLGGDKTLRYQNTYQICKQIQEVEYTELA